MTISDYVFERNIDKYVKLLEKEYFLKEQLSFIHDELINLSCCMTNEDIIDANEEFERIMREKEYK